MYRLVDWRVLPVILLLIGGSSYIVADRYNLLSGVSHQPQDDRAVTRKQFQEMMRFHVKRHVDRLSGDTVNQTVTPDSDVSVSGSSSSSQIPNRLKDKFDTRSLSLLKQLDLTYKTPATSDTQFLLTSLAGDTLSLRHWSGHWRLINFWASWCAPCRDEMPAFNRLHEQFSGKPLTIVAVNIKESRSEVKKFARQYSLDFPILLDQAGSLSKQYGTFTLPETWIITPSGQVLGAVQGPRNWDKEPASKLFKQLVGDTGMNP
ncbi:MAG: TlpA family protein disulfide reductase [bacterium]